MADTYEDLHDEQELGNEELDQEALAQQEAEAEAELQKKVSAGLARAFSDDDEDDAEDQSEEDEGSEGTETEDDSEEDESEEPGESEEGEAEEDDGEAAADGAPTLPEAHRRSLKAYGWQDEDIDQNLKLLGDQFLKTAERLHENRNTELSQWAAAGRQQREQSDPNSRSGSTEQPANPQNQQPPKDDSLGQQMKPVDIEGLKKKYGDDELIDEIAGPVNAMIASINSVLPQIQQGQQAAQQAEVAQARQTVERFFTADELKPYAEFYGSDEAGLSQEQVQAREKVLESAYDLMIGAETLHNRRLPMDEALSLAHEIVAKDFKATAIRKSLKKEAKVRNRAISQRPSSRRSPNAGPSSEEELERKVSKGLKNAFPD